MGWKTKSEDPLLDFAIIQVVSSVIVVIIILVGRCVHVLFRVFGRFDNFKSGFLLVA